MPFKIFTYADPYRISQTDFWNDIKGYPHLCASRTLVRGLLNVIEDDEINALMCPIDSIVKDRVFSDWANNIRRRIQQYSRLGAIYRKWHDKDKILSDIHYEAFEHNKNSMLDALRLFIELGIPATSIDTQKVNMEHRVFQHLLRIFGKDPLFILPKAPTKEALKEILIKQAEQEKTEFEEKEENYEPEYFKKRLRLFDKMIRSASNWDYSHIVVHGIHQFTPLQLRFITYLDKLGIEIIFLHNYLPEFKEIYSSWSYIYQQFEAPVHHDTNITMYNPGAQFQRTGNAIAENMALLCEEKIPRDDPRLKKNYNLYKDEKVGAFDNISEYAGYVSDLFSIAERKLLNEQPERKLVYEGRPSTSAVLARMEDVIYTANKDVDELLQVYHPEYARNRHFLAYPIGQFFIALYDLWNTETKEINIDYGLIRECVNSGILRKDNAGQLLKTLVNVEPLFTNISSYSKFKEVFKKYIYAYKRIKASHNGSIEFQLKALNIYNPNKVTEQAIDDLYEAVSEINKAAKELFDDTTQGNMIEFKTHFQRLRDFVNKKQPSLINKEERELIDKLIIRLDSIQEGSKETGTIDDIKAGLYYFLKQKEDPVSDWFVRNFEQIDGDVLLSKTQNRLGQEKIYHFASVSEKDMNRSVNDLLPWPLSDLFIEKAYVPKELPFQVYYASLCEHSNFLRYALFYGLYFSQCDTKISFVKRYGNDTTDYYEMLRLIGLEQEDAESLLSPDEYPSETFKKGRKVESIKYDRNKTATMMLCPYRFFLDYVMNPSPTFSGVFLLQKYYMNLIVENSWKAVEKLNPISANKQLSSIVDQQADLIENYFPFISETEKIDLKKQAEKYILSSSKLFNGSFAYYQSHMDLRRAFIKAKFFDDLQDSPSIHRYPAFENLSAIEEGKKTHSVHSAPTAENKQLSACMLDYINESNENVEQIGSWCMYCPDKDICLKPDA